MNIATTSQRFAPGHIHSIVAYGFEDSERLIKHFGVPREVISTSPAEFMERMLHALNLPRCTMYPPVPS